MNNFYLSFQLIIITELTTIVKIKIIFVVVV
jgi:hypothetical protein